MYVYCYPHCRNLLAHIRLLTMEITVFVVETKTGMCVAKLYSCSAEKSFNYTKHFAFCPKLARGCKYIPFKAEYIKFIRHNAAIKNYYIKLYINGIL